MILANPGIVAEHSANGVGSQRGSTCDEQLQPTVEDLKQICRLKQGGSEGLGWSPRMRLAFGYFTPDEYYEALCRKLICQDSVWADVGCGRDVFPNNRPLAQMLADTCEVLVGVDPDETIHENPFVHERVQSGIEEFHSHRTFDVITLRMVAEHIEDPDAVLRAFKRLTASDGKVVVYTVNRLSPVSLMSWLVPFLLHHPLKSWLWKTEEKDTFPVRYRMNTRNALKRRFEAHGFRELFFTHLDDCRLFQRFRVLQYLEHVLQKSLRGLGLPYLDTCILGVYQNGAR